MAVEAWRLIGGKFIMMNWNKDVMNKENKRGKMQQIHMWTKGSK